MKVAAHNVSLPRTTPGTLEQDQSFFRLIEDGREHRIRFHDYDEIFRRPGLYEQLFYERLLCVSPSKAREALLKVLANNQLDIHLLRILDLGAGNGMVGDLLDAARVVGVDISEQARHACERDRPQAYDAYYVADMTQPSEKLMAELREWRIDCLTCIAALGFGDIPVRAFANAFNVVLDGGWIVFNIKETFLSQNDVSGFSSLVNALMRNDLLQVHHLERYRHRISIDGEPLYYYLFVGRKSGEIANSLTVEH